MSKEPDSTGVPYEDFDPVVIDIMSVRDQFAATALKGLVLSIGNLPDEANYRWQDIADTAYTIADAMMVARKK